MENEGCSNQRKANKKGTEITNIYKYYDKRFSAGTVNKS